MIYPAEARQRSDNVEEPVVYQDIPTPLGQMRLAASAKGLRGVWFAGLPRLPAARVIARRCRA